MPKLKIKSDKIDMEVADDYPLINLAEEHDTSILFGCRDGACGACMIKVIEGKDNLSKIEDDEKDFLESMAGEEDERLACQCKVKGDVVIEPSE